METPYKVLYGREADLSHLKIIGSRAFVHINDSTKLGHTSWEGMVCSFSENESNSYRVWNPKTRRVVEARNVVFIETPPHLIPQPSQPSSLHRLQSSSLKFTEDTLDDNYVSNEEMLQDVRDYTAALDFNIDILADRDDLHGESSRGGVSTGNGLSGGDTSEAIIPSSSPASSLAPAPTSAPATAASKVTTRRTSRYVQHSGVTPAVTRSQASRQNQTHAETRNQRNSNNTFEAIAKLFGSDTLSHLCKLGPFSTEALDIAHQMYYRGTLSAEYAYAATNLQESCLRGGEKERIPNTFKKAMSLPKAAYWKEAADKEIQSLEKHGVYELVPMSFVPSSQKVVGTRWVNKIKADGTFKSRLVVQGWSQVPGIDYGGTFAPVCRLQSIRMMLAIAAELDYEIYMMDVQTAFLNADVDEEVFVKMPPGYERINKAGVPLVTKHIALRYFFVQELVEEGMITIHYVNTQDQLEDLGTKHLGKHRHLALIKLINDFKA